MKTYNLECFRGGSSAPDALSTNPELISEVSIISSPSAPGAIPEPKIKILSCVIRIVLR